MPPNRKPKFIVLYRWRLIPGTEQKFVDAWARVSECFLMKAGSLGSRLHLGNDGLWYSYAQWPCREDRERAFVLGLVDEETMRQMRASIAESFPEIILESIADFLVAAARQPAVGTSGREQ